MDDQGGSGAGELPVSDFLGALDLPPTAIARWMDHLEAFFARHGGERRYEVLAQLAAETRAALGSARDAGDR